MKEIKTTTTYSKEQIKKFLEIFFFEKTKSTRIIINILILIIIIYFFTKKDINIIQIIGFIFSLFGIIEVNTNMLPRINYKRMIKKNDKIIDSKVKYTFKENNFKISSYKDEYINYNELKKVIESSIAYYLYVDNSRAFVTSKTELSEREITILTNIFKEKVSTYKYKK